MKKKSLIRQNHYSGIIQRRLDFFFISNSLQEQVSSTDVTNAFCTDPSPILFTLSELNQSPRSGGLWKFNNSLKSNEYLTKMKKHIASTLKNLNDENIFDEHARWEFLKYEIRKFTKMFSKNLCQKENIEKNSLEETLKYMEENTKDFQTNSQYLECQCKLNLIYEKKVNDIKVRSKCNWYESGEKSSKVFLNLEKHHAIQSQLLKVIVNKKEIISPEVINNEIYNLYKNLFTEKILTSKEKVDTLNKMSLPKLDNQKALSCEGPITETELLNALKSMSNDKSPGNDGLTKEFYETFGNEIKNPLISSIQRSFEVDQLTISQRQAIIKLIKKKERDKRLIKNWRPISLLNLDTKLLSKALANL